ncbi:MAG: TonB-dependent receptor plug domain-containing protein [Rikenellaceae bacterium]|nr:TonB-dependent receptor plug domain-containing protein [Rikenellaceae bacterium]
MDYPYRGEQPITVILPDDATLIEDVVVTEIFTKARESYTGAVRQIGSAELDRAGNRSVLTSISNIDPSFNILTNLSAGSDPNVLPNITMRGNSSLTTNIRDLQSDSRLQEDNNSNLPLFILDGFEIDLERVMDINEKPGRIDYDPEKR